MLDEMLSYEDEAAPLDRRAGRIRWWRLARAVIGCAVVAYLGGLLLHGIGRSIGFPLAFVLLVAVYGLQKMVKTIGPGMIPTTVFKTPPPRTSHLDNEYRSDDGIRDGVKHWELRIAWTGTDAERFAATTQPALVELIDERLRLRHGIDRANDPDRARDLLGPQLWTFVNEPVKRRPTAVDLESLVAAMEAL